MPFDVELAPGARNAVAACLRIQPDEKVTLITDEACLEIAAQLARELVSLGVPCNAFMLEDLAPRPLADMPRAVLEDMETSQVSIFAVQAQANELRTRMQMTDVVNRRKIRHAHMVNIDSRIMLRRHAGGFRGSGSHQHAGLAHGLRRRTRYAPPTPAGTDITGTLNRPT